MIGANLQLSNQTTGIRAMNRTVKWYLINGTFAAGLYFGLIEGIEGAINATLVVAWASIVLSFFCVSDAVVEKLKEEGTTRAVSRSIRVGFDVCVFLTFAWFGYFVTAAFYIIHTLCIEVMYEKLGAEEPRVEA